MAGRTAWGSGNNPHAVVICLWVPEQSSQRRPEGQENKTPRGLQEALKRAPKAVLNMLSQLFYVWVPNVLCMGSPKK